MSLTFYYSPQSSASPVHWALEELGISYEKVRVDLKGGENKQPGYLAINPNGVVPALVHEGVTVFESAAIQIYLGETFGVAKGLYPAPGPRRGEALKWLVWCAVTLGDAVGRHFRNNTEYFPAEQRNAAAGQAAMADIGQHLKVLDQALTGRSFLVGEHFGLVDLHLSAWVDYVGMMGIDLAPYTAIQAWMARCKDRPSFARAE